MTEVAQPLLNSLHAINDSVRDLEDWFQRRKSLPVGIEQTAKVKEQSAELLQRVRQLEAQPTVLTVVLMGGTGVGKSTLLNALAGAQVAKASLVRPTTAVPTVYHHRDIGLDQLDSVFSECDSVAHERGGLRNILLVDTPDVDGNVASNHERLLRMLPVADLVLYVGSQEKYHDRRGWELLLEHRASHGFAFVLNKWDRCLHAADEATGRSPDVDFRQSLRAAGFNNPHLFRTCASHWLAQRLSGAADAEPINDDFLRLEKWLATGLNDRLIQNIKSRGLHGGLDELTETVEPIAGVDWNAKGLDLAEAWRETLREGVTHHAKLLVQSADRHGPALENHFARLGRSNFRGLFRFYLFLIDQVWKLNLSLLPTFRTTKNESIKELADRVVREIPSDIRSTHRDALRKHLLAVGDRHDWPVSLLEPLLAAEQPGNTNGLSEKALAAVLASELERLETEFTEPTGARRALRVVITAFCNWGPYVVLGLLALRFLYDAFFLQLWDLGTFVSAAILFVLTVLLAHLLLARFVPIQWRVLRLQLLQLIENRLLDRLAPAYLAKLDALSQAMTAERASLVAILDALRNVRTEIKRLEQTAEQARIFADS